MGGEGVMGGGAFGNIELKFENIKVSDNVFSLEKVYSHAGTSASMSNERSSFFAAIGKRSSMQSW